MVNRRPRVGSAQLQVGSLVKGATLALVITLTISGSSALAATKKPTPKPTAKASVQSTVKATAKATATSKATVKPSAKATAKATSKSTATSTVKTTPSGSATASATAKPKPKPKPKPRKKVRVTPSPRPKWPPAGFSQSGEVYAKVPNSKELLGVISAKGNLATQVQQCEKFVCGAVQVAAETGCTWWEVNSKVMGLENKFLGNLTNISGASEAKEIKTLLLISPELLETQGRVTGIAVTCHHEAKEAGTSSMTYTKAD